MARAAREAPFVRLRFLPKAERESSALRDGSVDLEVGLVRATPAPELRTAMLFRDRFVGVVSSRSPLSRSSVRLEDYLAAQHVLISRAGSDYAPVDGALAAQGCARNVGAMAGGFGAALGLARGMDFVATVPDRFTEALRSDLIAFPLPFEVNQIPVALVWHPRLDCDPCHRWLRSLTRENLPLE